LEALGLDSEEPLGLDWLLFSGLDVRPPPHILATTPARAIGQSGVEVGGAGGRALGLLSVNNRKDVEWGNPGV